MIRAVVETNEIHRIFVFRPLGFVGVVVQKKKSFLQSFSVLITHGLSISAATFRIVSWFG